MTTDERAAIRARDAAAGPVWPGSDGSIFGTLAAFSDEAGTVYRMIADRRALLAEVDRLTAELAEELVGKEQHRMWCVNGPNSRAAENERARIRAVVEGLWSVDLQEGSGAAKHAMVDRAAVLAAIDGEGE